MAEAVLATAPRMFAMRMVSAVMAPKLHAKSGGLEGEMVEVELGV